MTNKTHVILTSRYPSDDPDNIHLYELLRTLSNKTPSENVSYSKELGAYVDAYSVEFSDEEELSIKLLLNLIYTHRYRPYEEFINVRPTSFELSVSTTNIEYLNIVSRMNNSFLTHYLYTLDYVMGMQIEEINKLKDSVNILYSFIEKTGLVSQIKSYENLVEDLSANGYIKKENFKVKKPEIH